MAKVWELVKELEEVKDGVSRELAAARATMLVNWGPQGQCDKGELPEGGLN